MPIAAVLASWLSVGLLAALAVVGVRLTGSGPAQRARFARAGITRRIGVGAAVGGFVILGVLAALGQPLSFVPLPLGPGEPSLVAMILGASVIAGSFTAAQTAGARRIRGAMDAAADQPGSGLPRSGPVVLAGVARPRDGTVAVPGTDAEPVVYDARERRDDGGYYSLFDLLDDLGGHELAADELRDGRPFVLETERGDVVVEPADATLALHATRDGPARIEPGDAATVVGSVDRAGTGEASVDGTDGLSYVSDLPPGDLWARFDRRVHRGLPVSALTTVGPVIVAAYLFL